MKMFDSMFDCTTKSTPCKTAFSARSTFSVSVAMLADIAMAVSAFVLLCLALVLGNLAVLVLVNVLVILVCLITVRIITSRNAEKPERMRFLYCKEN